MAGMMRGCFGVQRVEEDQPVGCRIQMRLHEARAIIGRCGEGFAEVFAIVVIAKHGGKGFAKRVHAARQCAIGAVLAQMRKVAQQHVAGGIGVVPTGMGQRQIEPLGRVDADDRAAFDGEVNVGQNDELHAGTPYVCATLARTAGPRQGYFRRSGGRISSKR